MAPEPPGAVMRPARRRCTVGPMSDPGPGAAHGDSGDSDDLGGIPAGASCPGCGEQILVGQAVIRLTAGVLMADAHLDELIMRPEVFLHAGAGYDPRFNIHDRWCLTPEGVERATALLLVSDATSPSGH